MIVCLIAFYSCVFVTGWFFLHVFIFIPFLLLIVDNSEQFLQLVKQIFKKSSVMNRLRSGRNWTQMQTH